MMSKTGKNDYQEKTVNQPPGARAKGLYDVKDDNVAQRNDNHSTAREIAVGGLFLALAIVIPVLFHLVGLGKMFLPMFLPILTLGFLTQWRTAAAAGLLAPLVSSLFTGMPPLMPPVAPMMMVELAALAGIASAVYRKLKWGFWPAFIIAVVTARFISFLEHLLLAELFHIPNITWGVINLISGIPGLILQIVAVPVIIKLIEKRYPDMKPSRTI